jgi:DNA polymerase-3 subunit beta
MKLKADRATLLKALAHVQSVVERRNTIPILANVMLAVRDGGLTLTATDMEIAIVEDVAASTSRNGACTAPAATLYEIVRKLPDNAEIELDHGGGDGQLALRAGRYATKLVVLPTDDFPSMTAGTLPTRFGLSALALRGLIDRTRFAISTEETRYYLNGIYLHVADSDGVKMLRAVATDGHRLARVEEPLPDGAVSMPGVIVPRKTVNELRKLIDELTGEVEIGRVSAISSERSRPVKLSLARDLLVLSAASPEQGTATEELDGDRVKYEAGPLEIGFQARYLNDITDQIAGEVEFRFSDGSAPTVVRDAADASALYVLMPMRV